MRNIQNLKFQKLYSLTVLYKNLNILTKHIKIKGICINIIDIKCN